MKKWLYAGVLLVCACVSSFAFTGLNPNIPVTTTAQYDQMDKNKQVFVILLTMSYHCPPCRRMEMMLFPDLMKKYENDSNVHFYQVDIYQDGKDEANSLRMRFGAIGIPHLLVLYNDTALVSRMGFSENMLPALRQEVENVIDKFK